MKKKVLESFDLNDQDVHITPTNRAPSVVFGGEDYELKAPQQHPCRKVCFLKPNLDKNGQILKSFSAFLCMMRSAA
jgi:hypothetical protein